MSLLVGLAKAFNNNTFSDVKFLFETGESLNAHSVILASNSSVLHTMLTSGFKEATTKEILVKDISFSSFSQVIQFLYTEKAALQSDNVGEILHKAREYDIEPLCALCASFMEQNLSSDTALVLFQQSLVYHLDPLRKVSSEFIVANAASCLAVKERLDSLTLNSIQELLTLPLRIEEFELFKIVAQWVESSELDKEEVEEIMSKIELQNIAPEIIVTEVEPRGHIPPKQLYDAMVFHATKGKLGPSPRVNRCAVRMEAWELKQQNFALSDNERCATYLSGNPYQLGYLTSKCTISAGAWEISMTIDTSCSSAAVGFLRVGTDLYSNRSLFNGHVKSLVFGPSTGFLYQNGTQLFSLKKAAESCTLIFKVNATDLRAELWIPSHNRVWSGTIQKDLFPCHIAADGSCTSCKRIYTINSVTPWK